jgi:hypothetical protein
MPRTTTLTDAFAFFGAKSHNIRQAWSAVSEDGKTVVLTIWMHKAKDGTIDYFDPSGRARWCGRWGNKERKRHIQHALDHCDRMFRIVWVVARDPEADPKTIKDRIADPQTIMQITRFDAETGEFAASPV